MQAGVRKAETWACPTHSSQSNRLNFTKASAAALNANCLALGRRAPAGFSGRAICARCRRCKEAIAKQPVPQRAGDCILVPATAETSEKRQEVLAGMIDAVTKPKTKVKTKTER